MELDESVNIFWAKMPQYPYLPGLICTEEIPYNNIVKVCHDLDAVCIYFFGVHEYAWIDGKTLQNYSDFRQNYQKQRVHKMRRYFLDKAIEDANRFQVDQEFRYSILGSIQKMARNPTKAIDYYRAASKKPMDMVTFSEFVHCKRIVCDWENYDELMTTLQKRVRKQLKMNEGACVDTHTSIIYAFSPKIQKTIAESDAGIDAGVNEYWQRNYKFNREKKMKRLKIGYVSSDFRDHSLSHLFQSIPGMHDRSRFEIYCYALNNKDDSTYYKKISSEAEHFINISKKSDVIAADRIYSDGIDILINLNGHTEGARNEIFALRPAPIAATWLGFPCTMGASFIDYFIGDATVSPLKYSKYYSERLAHMPHTYFIGDHKQMFPHLIERISLIDDDSASDNAAIINGVNLYSKFGHVLNAMNGMNGTSETAPKVIKVSWIRKMIQANDEMVELEGVQVFKGTKHSAEVLSKSVVLTTREQYGLPTKAIIFCNFNQLVKLDPATFKAWLNVLKAVKNSVLWLLRYPADAENNLRKEAKNFGFYDNDRIIFTDVATKEEHVRRCQLADVCLDTTACNGHTTTMDVLWSGTPIVTMLGTTFAARVSASILNALGCPELVAKNLNEFEQIAIILGNSSTKLHDMRSKIRDLRLNSPLFDCQHFTNDLELLYEKMWQNYVKRNEPKNIFYSKCFLQSKCTY